MISELVKANRSCRRFYEDHSIELKTLEELVDLARLSASGANLQPLKYILACQPDVNAEIFSCLAWAGYLKDWPGPDPGERPSGYIVILGDTTISKEFGVDHGIAGQSMLLGARDKGLAGCMIASINRKDLRPMLNIESHLKILLVFYWRDAEAVHHLPKRALTDIIVGSHGS
jgi:nitroreductase